MSSITCSFRFMKINLRAIQQYQFPDLITAILNPNKVQRGSDKKQARDPSHA